MLKVELGCMRSARGGKTLCGVKLGDTDEQIESVENAEFCLLRDLIRRRRNDLWGCESRFNEDTSSEKKWMRCKISLHNKMAFKMSL